MVHAVRGRNASGSRVAADPRQQRARFLDVLPTGSDDRMARVTAIGQGSVGGAQMQDGQGDVLMISPDLGERVEYALGIPPCR